MAVPFFAFTACESEEEHKPGEPDVDGCYGVYFPSQQVKSSFDPNETLAFDVVVARKEDKGSISVPLDIIGNENGYFNLPSNVDFADGEAETSFTVDFSKAPVGEKMSLTIQITDPQYVSQYSSQNAYFSATLTVEKWNSLGMCKFRDDFVTTFYKVDYTEWEVEVLENASTPGYYRLVYPYGEADPNNREGEYDKSQTYYFEIHAEDPDGVYIPVQASGMDYGEGMFYMGSLAGFNISKGKTLNEEKSSGNTGTLVNGVITFPKEKLLVGMADYNGGTLYYANNNGNFRICLPGAVLVDYDLKASVGYASDGVVPVSFKKGADIASVKYAVYAGKLAASDAVAKASDIADGKEADVKVLPESGSAELTLGKTGVYTVVAVGFDSEGKAQASVSETFNYVAKEDESQYAVTVSAGLELTSRFEGIGATKTNSMAFYIYGSELSDVKFNLYAKSVVDKYGMDVIYGDVLEEDSVDAATLEKINGDGYCDVITKLSPLTEYVLVVWATNGYTDKFTTAELSTDGLPYEKLTTGTYTYTSVFAEEDGSPVYDKDLELYRDPNEANTYLIKSWCNNVDFKFTYDPASGKVEVLTQPTGVDYAAGMPVYVAEAKSYISESAEGYDKLGDSKYEASANRFAFFVVYAVPGAGYFTPSEEYFTLDEPVEFASYSSGSSVSRQVPEFAKSFRVLSGRASFRKSSSLSVPMELAGVKVR